MLKLVGACLYTFISIFSRLVETVCSVRNMISVIYSGRKDSRSFQHQMHINAFSQVQMTWKCSHTKATVVIQGIYSIYLNDKTARTFMREHIMKDKKNRADIGQDVFQSVQESNQEPNKAVASTSYPDV